MIIEEAEMHRYERALSYLQSVWTSHSDKVRQPMVRSGISKLDKVQFQTSVDIYNKGEEPTVKTVLVGRKSDLSPVSHSDEMEDQIILLTSVFLIPSNLQTYILNIIKTTNARPARRPM